ncbi:MAG: FAD-dependent pyridine nucleotide-disulfide oxidoreductase [uncultured bacterium]|nr:MAG: FAD-dependent pyridine nucleotide-disulfide oxidoreductase [uncultured bacterium]
MKVNDVIIIGAGPAGIAAAIQLKRYNITPLIIEKNEVGGLLRNANLVENYPGFPSGISGSDLIGLFHKQLDNNGLRVQYNEVLNVNYDNDLFSITTNKEDFFSKTLIIASGTIPRKLSIPDIPEELDNKIFYDVYKIKDENGKKIAIVGAGDAAFDYAVNLSGNNNEILILNRGNKTKCLPLLWDRYNNSSNIAYFENTIIKMIEKSSNNIKLTLYNADVQAENEIDIDYLLIAIGREPNLGFINDKFNEKIEELKNKDLLFVIGDVKNNIYRQTTICVGDGVKSAMQIYQKLSEI